MRHHHFARQYLSLQLWFSNKVWLNFWLLQLKIVFQLKGCLLFGEIMADLSRTFSEQGRKIWSDFRAYQIWFLPRESCDISSKEACTCSDGLPLAWLTVDSERRGLVASGQRCTKVFLPFCTSVFLLRKYEYFYQWTTQLEYSSRHGFSAIFSRGEWH